MTTPYEILDVNTEATDIEIKQAYLQKVKDCPPDHNTAQFHNIRDAYESINDHKSRLAHALFTLPEANFNQLVNQVMSTDQSTEVTAKHVSMLFDVSIDDEVILNSIPRKNIHEH